MKYKIGIIGSGRMANIYVEKLLNMQDVIISGICGRSESVELLARKTGAKAYYDYKQMLNEDDFDAVYITTPTSTHAGMAKAVAEKKINLFLEKPIALTVKEAYEVLKTIEDSGIICTSGHMFRYKNTVKKLKDIFTNKPIALINGHWYWTIPPISHIANKDMGGGPVVDQLIHLIDLARLFAGEINTVKASYTCNCRVDEDFNNWDGYAINLTFKNGTVGNISGTLALYDSIKEQSLLENCALDIIAKDFLGRFTPSHIQLYSSGEVKTIEDKSGEINEDFIAAIRSNDRSLIKSNIRDAVKTTIAVLACNHSAATGKVVSIDDYMKDECGEIL
ncbi:MAG: hypothetical protein APF76_09615 [Desulfitibacter sp. BRH_c19]|nr:MAG: hypothetical protein APF76_09615 [Desulfitibacter sp. BRH_c19]